MHLDKMSLPRYSNALCGRLQAMLESLRALQMHRNTTSQTSGRAQAICMAGVPEIEHIGIVQECCLLSDGVLAGCPF